MYILFVSMGNATLQYCYNMFDILYILNFHVLISFKCDKYMCVFDYSSSVSTC